VPTLEVDRNLVELLARNGPLNLCAVLGTEPMVDSSGQHDTAAPAAAWYKRLHVEPLKDGGEMLFGDAELTDLGASMLNAGHFRYGSVEIGEVVDNRTGETVPNVLRSSTLTNTPVLRLMPAVLDAASHIAASERVSIALSEISARGSWPGGNAASTSLRPDVELAAAADALMLSEDFTGDYGAAMNKALADDPALAKRYREDNFGAPHATPRAERPDVQLAERAKKLAEEHCIPYAEATRLVLAEDPALAKRYQGA